jgi:hypothetical protein
MDLLLLILGSKWFEIDKPQEVRATVNERGQALKPRKNKGTTKGNCKD